MRIGRAPVRGYLRGCPGTPRCSQDVIIAHASAQLNNHVALVRSGADHFMSRSVYLLRNHGVPCRAVPCRAVPRRAAPRRAAPGHAVPCRAIPCDIMTLSYDLTCVYVVLRQVLLWYIVVCYGIEATAMLYCARVAARSNILYYICIYVYTYMHVITMIQISVSNSNIDNDKRNLSLSLYIYI